MVGAAAQPLADAQHPAEGARLHVPMGLAIRTAKPIIWIEARINTADDAAIEADLAALPAMLDHVDGLLAEGVLGGARDRRRLPDRDERAPAAVLRGPPPGDRSPPRRDYARAVVPASPATSRPCCRRPGSAVCADVRASAAFASHARKAADERRRRAAVRDEVRRIAAGADDREEMRAIREQMAELAPGVTS